jgi:predicted nucleic acid-binding protein
VIDASITLAWTFLDENSAYANRVRDSLAADVAVVPIHWPLEVSNGLVQAERRGRSTPADTARLARPLLNLPIEVDTQTAAHAIGTVLDLARSQSLTVYDAAYLELAMRRGLPLATLDDDLRAAATRVGVPLVL